MLDKIDKLWVGLVAGFIIPPFFFLCYWLFFHSQLNFPYAFIRYLRGADTLQEISIVCLAFNLVTFYILLNKKAYDISKGIMYFTFAYVGLVLYISLT
jgi:hypothetical protein